jgi:hypothetical protein
MTRDTTPLIPADPEGALSQPVPLASPPGEAEATCGEGNAQLESNLPVADFLEPVCYTWSEAAFEARRALKRYSEQTHADY